MRHLITILLFMTIPKEICMLACSWDNPATKCDERLVSAHLVVAAAADFIPPETKCFVKDKALPQAALFIHTVACQRHRGLRHHLEMQPKGRNFDR